jgi:hypothetical protein
VHPGLPDRPEDLRLQSIVCGKPGPEEQSARALEWIAVGLFQHEYGDDGRLSSRCLTERPDKAAVGGRGTVDLDDQPGVLSARQQRGQTQRCHGRAGARIGNLALPR